MKTTTPKWSTDAPPAPIRRVVLTGGVATGKSHVLELFATRGVPTVDADQLAHAAVAPGGPAWHGVRSHFGALMFDSQGRLDRPRLGKLVFSDDSARTALNAIVHPHVRAAITKWFSDLESRMSAPFAIVAIPLFYETQPAQVFDWVIVTACQDDTQLARVMARGLPEAEARQRIDAQLPTAEKVRRADHAIWTDSTYAVTSRRVAEIYRELSADPHSNPHLETGGP